MVAFPPRGGDERRCAGRGEQGSYGPVPAAPPVTGVAVLALGFAASASAVVPGFGQLLHGNRAYLAITSLIGLAAAAAGVQMLITASGVGQREHEPHRHPVLRRPPENSEEENTSPVSAAGNRRTGQRQSAVAGEEARPKPSSAADPAMIAMVPSALM